MTLHSQHGCKLWYIAQKTFPAAISASRCHAVLPWDLKGLSMPGRDLGSTSKKTTNNNGKSFVVASVMITPWCTTTTALEMQCKLDLWTCSSSCSWLTLRKGKHLWPGSPRSPSPSYSPPSSASTTVAWIGQVGAFGQMKRQPQDTDWGFKAIPACPLPTCPFKKAFSSFLLGPFRYWMAAIRPGRLMQDQYTKDIPGHYSTYYPYGQGKGCITQQWDVISSK